MPIFLKVHFKMPTFKKRQHFRNCQHKKIAYISEIAYILEIAYIYLSKIFNEILSPREQIYLNLEFFL